MENKTAYSQLLLNNVHKSILDIFGYNLNNRQIGALINRQPKNIINELIETDGNSFALDAMMDGIAYSTTGIRNCPRPKDDAKIRIKFKSAVNRTKEKYFKPLLSI